MKPIKKISKSDQAEARIAIVLKETDGVKLLNSKKDQQRLKKMMEAKKAEIQFHMADQFLFIIHVYEKETWKISEALRKSGASIGGQLLENQIEQVIVEGHDKQYSMAVSEGLSLFNYRFHRHKTGKAFKTSLKQIFIQSSACTQKDIDQLNIIIESVCLARDLVNEPQNFLNSVQLSKEFEKVGKQAGFKVEVWNESKIEAQKMGGILAVNKASKIPPTFTIMEYKPVEAKNEKPYVLVGKGVVYDSQKHGYHEM